MVEFLASLDAEGPSGKRKRSQKYFIAEFQSETKVDVTGLRRNKMAAIYMLKGYSKGYILTLQEKLITSCRCLCLSVQSGITGAVLFYVYRQVILETNIRTVKQTGRHRQLGMNETCTMTVT